MKISVIIPVYNVENYIADAIASIQNQTYPNWEIILVDDGSTDNSYQVCQKIALNDERISVYQKENAGPSSARNFGLQQVTSDWIVFLDGDDYYQPYALELMVKIQQKYNADFVSTKIVTTDLRNHIINLNLEEVEAKNLTVPNALEEMYYAKNATVSPCGKLFLKKVLEKHPYPVHKLYEDLDVTYLQVSECKNIYFCDIQTYNYYRRAGSIVHSDYKAEKLYFFEAAAHNEQFVKQTYPNQLKLHQAIDFLLVIEGLRIINLIIDAKQKDELKKYHKLYFHYFGSILANNKISIKNKIRYILFLIHPQLYNLSRKKKK